MAPAATITVGQLLAKWMETEATRWKPRTASDYRKVCDRLVVPALGSIKLAKLTPDRLQRFLDKLRNTPRQANTVYRVLHRCFAVGVRWGYLPSNPCDRVIAPSYRPPRALVPTADELVRFMEAISDHPIWPWVAVAVSTGLRPGEQTALRWSDIDFDSGLMWVRRTGHWIDGSWVETEPKTGAGVRTISLGQQCISALHVARRRAVERQLKAGTNWHHYDLVFPSLTGRPLPTGSITPILGRLCELHGLPRLTPHRLRHAHASLLLNEHVPLPIVSRRLGHANTQVTASIYSHAMRGDDMAAKAIEVVLTTKTDKEHRSGRA